MERQDTWKHKEHQSVTVSAANTHKSSGEGGCSCLGEDQVPRRRAHRRTRCLWVGLSHIALSLSLLHSPDVEQMAIDWLTGNFYFVDDIDDRIFVCNRNGDTCVTLLDLELYNPKGIALDPAMG